MRVVWCVNWLRGFWRRAMRCVDKPHIRFKHNAWSCGSRRMDKPLSDPWAWRIGFGTSPREAYDDWKAQT